MAGQRGRSRRLLTGQELLALISALAASVGIVYVLLVSDVGGWEVHALVWLPGLALLTLGRRLMAIYVALIVAASITLDVTGIGHFGGPDEAATLAIPVVLVTVAVWLQRRREARQAEEEKASRFEALAASLPSGFLGEAISVAEGRVVWASKGAPRLLGMTSQALTESDVSSLWGVLSGGHADAHEGLASAYRRPVVDEWSDLIACSLTTSTGAQPIDVLMRRAMDADRVDVALLPASSRVSERRMADVMSSLLGKLVGDGSAVVTYDVDGRITFVSPSIEGILGYQPDALVGTLVFDHLAPIEAVDHVDLEATTEDRRDVTVAMIHADGEPRWVATTSWVIDEDDGTQLVVGLVQDVDARERQRREQSRESDDLSAVGRVSRTLVLHFSADGTCAWAPQTAAEILALAPEELVGRRLEEIIDLHRAVEPEAVGVVAPPHSDLADSSRPPVVAPLLTSATTVWLEVFELGWDPWGGRRVVVRDVTAKALLHEALGVAVARADLISAHTEDVMFGLDADDRIIWAEGNVEAVLGYAPSELVGRPFGELTDNTDVSTRKDPDGSERLDTRMICRDNHVIWVAVTRTPVESGPATAGISTLVELFDNSRNKELELQKDALLADLEQRESEYRLLAENASDSVIVVDNEGRIEWASAATERSLAWSAERLLGTYVVDLLLPDSDYEHGLANLMDNPSAIDPEGASGVGQILGSDGVSRWVSVRLTSGPDSSRTIIAISTVDEIMDARADAEASELRLRTIIDTFSAMSLVLTPVYDESDAVVDLIIDTANEAASVFLDPFARGLFGRRLASVSPALCCDAFLGHIEDARHGARVHRRDLVISGTPRDLMFELSARQLESGMSVTLLDVTEDRAHQALLTQSERRFRLLAENVAQVVFEVDRGGRIRWVSPSVKRVLGWEQNLLWTRPVAELFPPSYARRWAEFQASSLSGDDESLFRDPLRWRVLDSDGQKRWVSMTISRYSPDEDPEGQWAISLTVIDSDVEREQDLDRQASIDPLTGALLRGRGMEQVQRMLKGHRTGDSGLGAIYVDFDNFKDLNDSFGHGAGDAALSRVIGEVLNRLRPADVVVRTGGDEFLIVVSDVRSKDDLMAVALAIREVGAQSIPYEGGVLVTTLSVGVTPVREGEVAQQLIARADLAMYESKAGGGNRVTWIDFERGQRPVGESPRGEGA